MQPGIDLRLRAMMKALAEVVLPAVDPSNRAAAEQGAIVLGSLDMLRQQIDYAHWYEVEDLRSQCELAEELAAISDGGEDAGLTHTVASASAIAERYDVPLSALRENNIRLRDRISALVETAYESQSDHIKAKVQQTVLAHSERQIGRERAYVAAMKWDIFPESLQSIETALSRA